MIGSFFSIKVIIQWTVAMYADIWGGNGVDGLEVVTTASFLVGNVGSSDDDDDGTMMG
jgi:hypothetical protein